MKKIGLIGAGRVGLCLAGLMARAKISVLVNDKNPSRKKALLEGDLPFFEPELKALLQENQNHLQWTQNLEDLLPADMIFFCMSQPFHPKKGLNLKEVFALTRFIAKRSKKKILLVVKSSFPPGTNKKMREMAQAEKSLLVPIVCPEFLRQGQALQDILQPDRLVIGSTKIQEGKHLEAFYKKFCQPKQVFHTDPETAELAKLASNSFLALKISFANYTAGLCEPMGANPKLLRKILGTDPRIGSDFLTPGLGYGGTCLPKDLHLTLLTAKKRGQNTKFLKAIKELNQQLPEEFYHKIKAHFRGQLKGIPLAFWGLSFKKNTDDLNHSPAFELLCLLLRQGALLSLYDPLFTGAKAKSPLFKNQDSQHKQTPFWLKHLRQKGLQTFTLSPWLFSTKKKPLDFLKQKIKEGRLTTSPRALESLIGKKGLIIGSNADEFKIPLPEIKKRLTEAFIVDGRGLFSPKDLKIKGFAFYQKGVLFKNLKSDQYR